MTATTDIVATITSHHAELQDALTSRVEAVVRAARDGHPHAAAVAELRALLATEIVPHARAEEDVLYAAATAPALRPLVAGMIFEHQTLLALADDLAAASSAVDATAAAAAIRAVFVGHVHRENDLLLPDLAGNPDVDLPALLPLMQDLFTSYRAAAQG